jgi:hypothetical protein
MQGTSDEVALLIAEFALLDAPVAALAAAVAAGEAARIDGGELARLASDIPDLRSRLGIRCAAARILLQPRGPSRTFKDRSAATPSPIGLTGCVAYPRGLSQLLCWGSSSPCSLCLAAGAVGG